MNDNTAIRIMAENVGTIGEKRHQISQQVINNYKNSEYPLDKLACGLAYINEGAKYRKNAIECIEYYFLHNNVAIPVFENNCPYFSEWFLHSELSTLYEKEYMFDKAIQQLELCIQCNQNEQSCAEYTRIADLLVKQADVVTAIRFIDELRKRPVYKQIQYGIDNKYNELLLKKERGYVYKPRKK